MTTDLFNRNKQFYMTRGIQAYILPELVKGMLDSIMEMKQKTEVDYLQIFDIESKGNTTYLTHHQEVPEYKKQLMLTGVPNEFNGKVYVIDDGPHVTVLLADEY